MGDRLHDFYPRNGITLGQVDPYWDYSSFYPSSVFEGGSWTFRYRDSNCLTVVPALPLVLINQNAGIITEIYLTYSAQNSFAQAMEQANKISAVFNSANWPRTVDLSNAIESDYFRKAEVGQPFYIGSWQLCERDDQKVFVEVEKEKYHKDGESYFVYVRFKMSEQTLAHEASELMVARRKSQPFGRPVSAKVWVDDPDWRPPGWAGKLIK